MIRWFALDIRKPDNYSYVAWGLSSKYDTQENCKIEKVKISV
jgi:hypothetical protein